MSRLVGMFLVLGILLSCPAFAADPDPRVVLEALARPGSQPGPEARDPDLYRRLAASVGSDPASALAARDLLERVTAAHPDLREAWFGLGYLDVNGERPDRVEKAARKALEVSPGWGLAENLLGVALLDQGKPDEARSRLTAALKADPTLPFPLYHLFRIAAPQGKCGDVVDLAATTLRNASRALRPKVLMAIGEAASSVLNYVDTNRAPGPVARCLERLGRIAGDPAIEAAALMHLSDLQRAAGNGHAAERLCDQALKEVDGGAGPVAAEVLTRIGTELALRRDPRTLEVLGRARQEARAADRPLTELGAIRLRCRYLGQASRPVEQRACQRDAADVAAKAERPFVAGVLAKMSCEGVPVEPGRPCECLEDATAALGKSSDLGVALRSDLIAVCMDGLSLQAQAKRMRTAGLDALDRAAGPEGPEAMALRADLLGGIGRREESLDARRRAIEAAGDEPDLPRVWVFHQEARNLSLLAAMGRRDEALKIGAALLERYTREIGDGDGYLLLVGLLDASDWDWSRRLCEVLVPWLQAHGDPLVAAEWLFLRAGHNKILGRTEAVLRDLEAIDPLLARPVGSQDALRHADLSCRVAREQRAADRARTECERWVALAESSGNLRHVAFALDSLGNALELAGDRAGALAARTRAATESERVGDLDLAAATWDRIGLSHRKNRQAAAAEAAARKALSLAVEKGTRMSARMNLAAALHQAGRFADARAALTAVVDEAGEDPPAWDSLLGATQVNEDNVAQRIVWEAFRNRVQGKDLEGRLSVLGKAYAIELEGRMTGDIDRARKRLSDLLEEARKAGGVPEVLSTVAAGLAYESGRPEAYERFEPRPCSERPGEPCGQMTWILGAMLGTPGIADGLRSGNEDATWKARGEMMGMILGGTPEEALRRMLERGWKPAEARLAIASSLVLVDNAKAVALSKEALSLVPADADAVLRVSAHAGLGRALAAAGSRAEAVEALRLAAEVARREPEGAGRGRLLLVIAGTHAAAALCDEGRAVMDETETEFAGSRRGHFWLTYRSDYLNNCGLEPGLDQRLFEAHIAEVGPLASGMEDIGLGGMAAMMRLRAGMALGQRNDADRSLEFLRDSVATIERTRMTTRDLGQRAGMFSGMGSWPYEYAIEALLKRGRPGDAAEAFGLAERTRGWTLLEHLGRQGLESARTTLPPGVRSEEAERSGSVDRAAAALAEIERMSPWDDDRIASAQAELKRAQGELEAFAGRLWKDQPAYASIRFPRSVDVAHLPLSDDELLIEYRASPFWGVAAWVIGREPGDPVPKVLHAGLTGVDLVALRQAVGSGGPGEAIAMRGVIPVRETQPGVDGGRVTEALLRPLIARMDPGRYKRLMLVVDDALERVPMEAFDLSAVGGCPARDGSTGRYLADCMDVSYAPSAAILALLREAPATAEPPAALLAVGDPVFSRADPRGARLRRTPEAGAGRCAPRDRLPASGTEVQAVSSMLCSRPGARCRVLTGIGATEEAWLAARPGDFRVIHIASHTTAVATDRPCDDPGENPEPALVMSLATPSAGDNLIARSEVMGLDLRGTRLAVLSACSSAAGRHSAGEGISGLAAAFLHAGVRQVVGSLWPVPDAPTAKLMSEFYRVYSAGGDAVSALAAARRAIRADEATANPFFWAGFVVYGR